MTEPTTPPAIGLGTGRKITPPDGWVMAGESLRELTNQGRPPAYDERAASSREGSHDGRYGLRDLVRLAIDHGGLGSYTHVRYESLRHALGLKVDLVAKDGGPLASRFKTRFVGDDVTQNVRAGAPRIASAAVAQARAIEQRGLRSPFASYKEATPDLHALYLEFDGPIKMAIEVADRADRVVVGQLIDLAMAAVISAEPAVEGRMIHVSELRPSGWPDPPVPVTRHWDD